MPKRLTYNEVKKNIELQGCELLSDKYINNSSKLVIKCKCGKIYERTYYHFSKGMIDCFECKKNKFSNKYRMPFDDVLEIIHKSGCEYISGEYKNNKSILTMKCKCGNIFERNISKHKRNPIRCQKCANKSTANSKIKYKKEDAIKILATRGYTLLGEYVNASSPMMCVCKNGHINNIILSQFLVGCSGCSQCAIKEHCGSKHWNYKGGESEILDYFRKNIKQWKFNILKKNNYNCFLTNNKNDLVIHHLKSFNTIIHESCYELNIQLERKLKDYDEEILEKLKEKVFLKHTLNEGIVLQRKVHNKFHSIYGKGNNTVEQFEEFIKNNYPYKLKEFKEKYNLVST